MELNLEKILDDFKKLYKEYPERFTPFIERIFDNLDNTQRVVIKNRVLIASYSCLYILAVMSHLNLLFINQYLNISTENPFLSIESVERLIIIIAPLFLTLVYYLLMVSKIRRGLYYVVLNKYYKYNMFAYELFLPYSTGGTRGFLDKLNGRTKSHNFNKFVELYYYLFIILISMIIFVFEIFKTSNFHLTSIIVYAVIILASLYMMFKINMDVKRYKKIKKTIESYNLIE